MIREGYGDEANCQKQIQFGNQELRKELQCASAASIPDFLSSKFPEPC